MPTARLAVVTGSGLDATDVLESAAAGVVEVDGAPVPHHVAGDVVVLDRHVDPTGPGGRRPAHRIDHARNLAALVALGCDRVLALGSVGSLRPDWPVGTVAVPDDFFAPWVNPTTFTDARGHRVPGFAPSWRAEVLDAWRQHDAGVVDGAVYAQTIGPRFETGAEIRWLASVADVVGMTVAAECVVAGELGLAYAAVCTVDNLANGVAGAALTTDEFRDGVAANRQALRSAVRAVVARLGGNR